MATTASPTAAATARRCRGCLHGEDGSGTAGGRPRLTVGDAEAHTAAVLAGLGIAQLATWLVHEHLASGAIVEVLPACATPGLPLSLAWPLARQLTTKTGTLLRN